MSGLVFSREYVDAINEKAVDYVLENDKYKGYSIEFPDGLADPPIIEVVRLLEEAQSFELKEKLTRYCILKKPVKIKLGDEYVEGGFTMNTLDVAWDSFPLLTKHALALQLLIQVCTSHLLEKSMPSTKSTL
jgi:hypothetical protein